MSVLKTVAEITSAQELIQALEELKSGSLAGPDGINRALERLATNDAALFAALQSSANSVLTGGGTWGYASTTLSWSSALQVRWADITGAGVHSNQVATGNISLPDAGGLAYVILNRTSDGATVTVSYAASMDAFRAILAATTARADYFILAYRSGSHVILHDGRRVLNNQTLSSDGTVDSQYAQTSAFLAVRNRQTQNHNLRLIGGGTLEWAVALGTGTFSWSADLSVLINGTSTAGAAQRADFVIDADDLALDEGQMAYLDLGTRAPGTGGIGSGPSTALQVADYDATTLTADQLLIAVHHTDGRLYLMNGQSIGDGDVATLGGAVSGLQWYVGGMAPGPAEQVVDLTMGGAAPGNQYPVGTHALMVYRNGQKLKASDAVWAGTYPTGSLTGTILAQDDYVEEDAGDGHGTRFLWLRDTDSPDTDEDATGVYRTWATPVMGVTSGEDHDPPRTWPTTTSYVEAFLGVQGQGPSPVEAVRIDGEDPLDDLDGIVVFKAGAGIVLTYDAGTLKISVDSGAPVTSIDAGSGPQGGALTLGAGTGIGLDDSTPGTIVVNLDADLDDINGVDTDRKAAILGAQSPTANNPLLTRNEVEPVQGFDLLWSPGGVKTRVVGGVLNSRSASSSHVIAGDPYIEADTISDTYGGALVVGTWVYVYAHHDGASPALVYAILPPSKSVGFGVHPASVDYVFLLSAYYDSSGYVYPFSKAGERVTLARELDISASFASAVGTLAGFYAWVSVTPSPLPATAGARASFRLRVTVVDPPSCRGNLLPLYVRATGGAGYRKVTAVMASKVIEPGAVSVDCDVVEFEFEAQLDGDGSFEISLPDTIYTGAPSVWLTGYDEPKTRAAAAALGA